MERDALAIVWAVERFMFTDMINPAQSRPPARVERLNLCLVLYTSVFLHPHLPINGTSKKKQFQNMAEKYFRFLTCPKAMTLPEIQQARL